MSKQMLELADRLAGSLQPFDFLTREERDLVVSVLRGSAVSAQPLRRCGMCMTWNSKPCGEQCGWSPDDPTPEQAKAKDLKEKRRHNRKHPLPVTFE